MQKNLKVVLSVAMVLAIGGAYLFPQIKSSFGAVSTLDGVDHPFVTVNGHKEWRGRIAMSATSSNFCSFANPFGNATSTVESISAESTNSGISDANNLLVATTSSTSRHATSSNTSWNAPFAMGTGQWSYDFRKNTATSSASTNAVSPGTNVLVGVGAGHQSMYVVGPNEYVGFFFATSTAGTFSTYDQGFCSAVFRKI